jgi:hypothetical protein
VSSVDFLRTTSTTSATVRSEIASSSVILAFHVASSSNRNSNKSSDSSPMSSIMRASSDRQSADRRRGQCRDPRDKPFRHAVPQRRVQVKPYERALLAGGATGHTYARGNYAFNGGPNRHCYMSVSGCKDGYSLSRECRAGVSSLMEMNFPIRRLPAACIPRVSIS